MKLLTTEQGTLVADLNFSDAVTAAISDEMEVCDDVVYFCTAPPKPLVQRFGAPRVVQTPISEHGVTGLAVGAAASGLRPVVSWRNVTFGMSAYDQLTNQAAKLRYMLGGQLTVPLVIHATYGGGKRMAAQHMQTPYAIFAGVPGLRVVAPYDASDAYRLMRDAIRMNDPVVFLEGVRLASVATIPHEGGSVPFGKSQVRRRGRDVTVVAIGFMVHLALEAAEELAGIGIDLEVVDLISLTDIDSQSILDSVARTGHLIVVDEAPSNCSVAAEVIARVSESTRGLAALAAPPVRISGLPVPIPYSPVLEDAALPDTARIVQAAKQLYRSMPSIPA